MMENMMNMALVSDELRQQFIAMNFPTLMDVAKTDYNIDDEMATKQELVERIVAIEIGNMMK